MGNKTQKPGWHQADLDDEENQTENRIITKKKGEKFAWRSEAVNRLCEERYQVSQRLLFGPIFYLYIYSRRKLL